MTESKPLPLGDEIDSLFKIREEIRALEASASELKKKYDERAQHLRTRMVDEQVQRASGRYANAAVDTSEVPSVKDWDSFYKYIHRNKYYHLLERRPSVSGCRELFGKGQQIPGVEPYVKNVLRLTVSGDD